MSGQFPDQNNVDQVPCSSILSGEIQKLEYYRGTQQVLEMDVSVNKDSSSSGFSQRRYAGASSITVT